MLAALGIGALLAVLLGLLLGMPLMMAFWFAPALVVLRNDEPLAAMKASFDACLRNMLPMLVYGLLGLVFAIVASIPFGLGLARAGAGVRGQHLRELQGHLRRARSETRRERGQPARGEPSPAFSAPAPSSGPTPTSTTSGTDSAATPVIRSGSSRRHARELGLRHLEHQLVVDLQHELRREPLAVEPVAAPRSSRA